MSVLLKSIQDARKARAKAVHEAGEIVTKAATESRALTKEEHATWTKIHEDAQAQQGRIDVMERQLEAEKAAAELDTGRGGGPGDRELAGGADDAQRSRVLRAWFGGHRSAANLSGPDQAAAKRLGIDLGNDRLVIRGVMPKAPKHAGRLASLRDSAGAGLLTDQERASFHTDHELRAEMTTSASSAIVPKSFMASVEVALLAWGGMREAATVLRTADGRDLPMPTVNDTGNTGEQVDEAVAVAEKEVTVAATTFKAFTFSSKMIPLSLELLQDEGVNIESMLGEIAGTRIGRILNTKFTTGAGTTTPKGIVVAATASGITTASATAVTYAELLQLKHSVDPAYRLGGLGRWMFNDSTLLALKLLADTTGRPLWQPGIGVGNPDTLDGDRFIVNQDMASLTATQKAVLYGAVSKYVIRDVMPMELVVLRERYAEKRLVGVFAFSRHDGQLLDAGTHPVKYLTQHA